MSDIKSSRRQFMKLGSAALALIPVLTFSAQANAATNAGMRAALKYQTHPNGKDHCGNCMHFKPGKSPTALGGCQIMPGDTEISPHGYCVGWTAKS
jgi:hypothetical protein